VSACSCDGDVRARRRHVADERVDLGGRHDLDTTVSGVQSAIALEALVSAAFILISSKVGDLIGRKRAYVLGLLGYASARSR
jgi:MFS family permease